jgi:hypothetical protein
LHPLEVLAKIHNPGKWEDVFLVFAIKRCRLLWLDVGIPLEFVNDPTFLSEWAIEALQKEKSFCSNFVGTKQEFLSKWTEFWEVAQRELFSKIIHQYGLEKGGQLRAWCYWRGGVAFPLQLANKKHRNSTWSILDAWGCVISDLVYHYEDQAQCDVGECPSLPPEILDWIEAAEDLQNLKELPEKVPEFNDQRPENENDLPYSPLLLPAETINLIRQTMFNYYHPDASIDDDRVAAMLARIETVPLDSRELELLKYIGTEYSSDEEDSPPRYTEKYTDLNLTLKTLFRYHRVYSVIIELEKLLKEPEKKALVEWARKASVYPPFGNANALLWPSEVGEERGENVGKNEDIQDSV